MSDTPRTDAEAFWPHDAQYKVCDAVFARQLEGELNAANAIIRQQQLLQEENLRLQDRIKRLDDIIHRASCEFFRDGSDGQVASGMLTILEEGRKP